MPSIEYFASATESDIGAKECFNVDVSVGGKVSGRKLLHAYVPLVFKEVVFAGGQASYVFRDEALSAAVEFILDCKMINTANSLGLKLEKERKCLD